MYEKLAQGLIAFLAMIAVSVWTVSAFTVPQPLENFYVADYANVINSQDAEAIRTVNKNLEARNGSQIVVATFDFLDGEAIDDVAYDLFNGWKIGSADDNNGVLLVLAIGKKIITACKARGWRRHCRLQTFRQFWDHAGAGICGRQLQQRCFENRAGAGAAVGKNSGTPVLDPSQSQGGGGARRILRNPHSACLP